MSCVCAPLVAACVLLASCKPVQPFASTGTAHIATVTYVAKTRCYHRLSFARTVHSHSGIARCRCLFYCSRACCPSTCRRYPALCDDNLCLVQVFASAVTILRPTGPCVWHSARAHRNSCGQAVPTRSVFHPARELLRTTMPPTPRFRCACATAKSSPTRTKFTCPRHDRAWCPLSPRFIQPRGSLLARRTYLCHVFFCIF